MSELDNPYGNIWGAQSQWEAAQLGLSVWFLYSLESPAGSHSPYSHIYAHKETCRTLCPRICAQRPTGPHILAHICAHRERD